MPDTEIKNIKFHVVEDKGKRVCRLTWVGCNVILNKDDTTHKIPTDKIAAECIDFDSPEKIYAAKDALVAAIKRKYDNPVSIKPSVGENELLIDEG